VIVEIIKALLVPGSLSFFVVGCVASSVLIAAGGVSRRIGQTSLALLVLTYLVFSLPWVAERLAATLAARPPGGARRQITSRAAAGPRAIVIFSGDYSRGRIDEAVRLYQETDPRWVIVSGWPALSQSLVARGVARERLVWDSVPLTTREQAMRLVPLLRARDIDDFVLIASSIHMRRALGAVHAVGLDPAPVESAVARPWVASGRARLLPDRAALRLTYEVMYEHLALALYANRGWLASDPTPLAAGDTTPPLVPRVATPPPLPLPGGHVVHVSSEPMLQTAVRHLASDTTVVLAPGTYRLTSTLWINGRVSNIALVGATQNRDDVVLTGPGMRAPAAGVPHGIWTGGGVHDITIANLTIRDVAEHAIVFNAGTQQPRVYNVRLVDTGQQFIKSNPDPGPGDDVEGRGVNDGRVEYSLIEYTSSAKDGYTNGIDVHAGANWIIRHNVFRNIVSPAGQLAGPAVLMWNGSRDTLTEGNTFLNCARGISYGLEQKSGDGESPDQFDKFDHRGGIIRNNFFFRSADQPGDVGIMVADSPGTEVLHNTVFVSGTHPSSIEYRFRGARDVVVANNRLDGTILARDGARGTERNNVSSRD
jgi:uncharacterized SAM-binding protein YcdF (DUF218 family)